MSFFVGKTKLLVFSCFISLLLTACTSDLPHFPAELLTTTPTSTAAATTTPTATAPAPCPEPAGTVTSVNVPGKTKKTSTALNVYTPPCYSSTNGIRYPVLYMLHGQTYDDTQWLQLGLTADADQLIASGQIAPLIIVMPNEADSMSDADTSTFGDVMINEVIPWVDQNYATCDVRECRAIGGLSRGGNWAIRLGLSHPDYFAVIGAHSAPLFYGDLNRITTWIKAIPSGSPTPMIYIDFGRSDEDKDEILQFNNELNDLGVVHQMVQFNGFHVNQYWAAHAAEYLRWYAASLAKPQVETGPLSGAGSQK